MKVGFLITGRMKSTRLPQKLILEIHNRPIIKWMIDRIKLSKKIDDIVICTSTHSQDDILETIALEEGIKSYRGDEEDVIQRLYDAAVFYNCDYVLNITGDCPLVSFEYIDEIVDNYKQTNADLIRTLDLPHGFFSYGLKVESLKKVCDIKDGTNTEVWGRYFTDTGLFKVLDLNIPKDLIRPDFRLTLDYPADFEFFKALYNHFGEETYMVSTNEIISFLDDNPQIVDINKNLKHAYKIRWNQQNHLKIK